MRGHGIKISMADPRFPYFLPIDSLGGAIRTHPQSSPGDNGQSHRPRAYLVDEHIPWQEQVIDLNNKGQEGADCGHASLVDKRSLLSCKEATTGKSPRGACLR